MMRELTQFEYYVLCALPEEGEAPLKELAANLRDAEILFSAKTVFTMRAEPESVRADEEMLARALADLARDGLLDELRRRKVVYRDYSPQEAVKYGLQDKDIQVDYDTELAGPTANIGKFFFAKNRATREAIRDGRWRQRYGELAVPLRYRPLRRHHIRYEEWAGVIYAMSILVLVLFASFLATRYWRGDMDLAAFLLFTGILLFCTVVSAAMWRKYAAGRNVEARRITWLGKSNPPADTDEPD